MKYIGFRMLLELLFSYKPKEPAIVGCMTALTLKTKK